MISDILESQQGSVGGVWKVASKWELQAKRETKRSAYSSAVWASSPNLIKGGRDNLQKFASSNLASDQLLPDGYEGHPAPIRLIWSKQVFQAIFLLDLAA